MVTKENNSAMHEISSLAFLMKVWDWSTKDFCSPTGLKISKNGYFSVKRNFKLEQLEDRQLQEHPEMEYQ